MRHQKYAGQTRSWHHRASRRQSSTKTLVGSSYTKVNWATAYLENGESLDVTSGGNVRTTAQIDQRAAAVNRAESTVGYTLVNEVLLVFAVLEHLKKFILGHLETLERLLLLDDGA